MEDPAISNILSAFDHARSIYSPIELQQLEILLVIAAASPAALTHEEIGEKTNLTRTTVGRNVGKFEEKFDKNGKQFGLGLLDQRPDPYETRRLSVRLTDKGRDFVLSFIKKLNGSYDNDSN